MVEGRFVTIFILCDVTYFNRSVLCNYIVYVYSIPIQCYDLNFVLSAKETVNF